MPGVQTCALRSEEHTSELQSHDNLVCRLLLEKKKNNSGPGAAGRGTTGTRSGGNTSACSRLDRRLVCGGVAGRGSYGRLRLLFFFFNDTATTEIYTLSLHDALPISNTSQPPCFFQRGSCDGRTWIIQDRKSTRLNSSHTIISYAVFCLKKKKTS